MVGLEEWTRLLGGGRRERERRRLTAEEKSRTYLMEHYRSNR